MAGGYFVVQWWMANDLKLKGNELLVFAIIYGFTQDGECEFTGSLKYLATFTNSNISTIQRSLTALVEKGLINKREAYLNGNKYCYYKAVQNAHGLCKMPIPPVQNAQEPMCKMHNNNITNNIKDIIECVRTLGTANNVKLSDRQIEDLKKRLPEQWEDLVEELSLAKAGKGYKNKDDYYTILSWARKEDKKAKAKEGDKMPF